MPSKPIRTRPYKDFLTPALHRRFSSAAGILVLICYLEALIFSNWNSWIWPWFPLGLAGFRTSLFFICAFMLFILRVRNLHVGMRTTVSPFHTFVRHVFSWETAWTLCVYIMSALLFVEVFVTSLPGNTFERVTTTRYERSKLNEKVVYLRSFFLMLASVHAASHVLNDYDRIDTRLPKDTPEPLERVRAKFPVIFFRSLALSFLMATIGPIVYMVCMRDIAWSWSLSFARLFYTLPQSSVTPTIGPFAIAVLLRSLEGGFLLGLLWGTANAAFTESVLQAPLKDGKPITFESRDPNGSLLTGLKGKKAQTRAFAFWELACIADNRGERRKLIFADIDRPGGSAWSQILEASLVNITAINDRITATGKPTSKEEPAQQKTESVQSLPRLTQAPQEKDIFTPSPVPVGKRANVAHSMGTFAKAHGQSPGSPIAEQAKALYGFAKSSLSPEYQQAATPEGVEAIFQSYAKLVLKNPLGWPFRLATRRRVSLVILGSPYGDYATILNSIEALTNLSIKSLAEDDYGNVQRDVPRIIRTYTKAIVAIDGFLKGIKPHWADVDEDIECLQTNAILLALRKGLGDLMAEFGGYARDLKLTEVDLRQAKAAATLAPAPTSVPSPTIAPGSAPAMISPADRTPVESDAYGSSDADRRAQRARDRELERQRERARRRENRGPEMREVTMSGGL